MSSWRFMVLSKPIVAALVTQLDPIRALKGLTSGS